MLLVTTVVSLLWQDEMSAVRRRGFLNISEWLYCTWGGRETGWQLRESSPSCFLSPVRRWNPRQCLNFSRRICSFVDCFTPIWFRFELRPRGLVYSSLHHLGNQEYNSDSQFPCWIRYADESFPLFVCLLRVFLLVSTGDEVRVRRLTGCHAGCPSSDESSANVEKDYTLLMSVHAARGGWYFLLIAEIQ